MSAISADEQRIWLSLLPVLVGGLALLFAFQVPLFWGLARRFEHGRIEREHLLQEALAASDKERRRIAGELHDGVVQDLAGVSLSLAAAATRLRVHGGDGDRSGQASGSVPTSALMEGAADTTRRAVRDLRTLIVDISPLDLGAANFASVLADLSAAVAEQGVDVRLDVPDGQTLPSGPGRLVFRVAQELLRNVAAHAQCTTLVVRLRSDAESISLEIRDNGRGFTPADLDRRRSEGHLGMTLLGQTVRDSGGTLEVTSTPAAGTAAVLTIPVEVIAS